MLVDRFYAEIRRHPRLGPLFEARLAGIREDDFMIWLEVFETTTDSLFDSQLSASILTVARRIARSLWLARFGTPFSQAPAWLS